MEKKYIEVYVVMNVSYGEIYDIVVGKEALHATLHTGLLEYGYDDEEIEEMHVDGYYADVFEVYDSSVEIPQELLK